jgi:hypothetical protein
MDGIEASQLFLRDTAAKHFVCLSYHARAPGRLANDAEIYFASCFVVEIEEHWLLVTAGHVINGIREAVAKGATYSDFNLHDKLAGNNFPFSVPIPFDIEDWVVIEEYPEGADYAAAPISSIIVRNLQAGGIRPIAESIWGAEPFDQYRYWLLAGIPDESYEMMGTRHTLKLTVMPLIPALRPSSLIDSPSENRVFAEILTQPQLDSVFVTDIKGMSGGPIFGLKESNGVLRYWLIGIQSSWYPDSRVISFCPIRQFFAAIKKAIKMTQANPALLGGQ